MSLAPITLTTDKTLSDVGNYVRKIGQGEAGQKLEVIVTDAYGSGYNLNGKTLEFSENKEGGKIVSDNDLDHFEIKDAEAGRFVYTLASAVYAASGVAWFDITSANGSVIDTTKNFNINVIEDESIHINNDNYVSSLAAFETHYDGVIKKTKEDSEALLTKINEQLSQALTDNNQKVANSLADQKAQLQKLIDSTNQLQTDWNVQFTKQKQSLSDVATSWQTQFKKIQDDANSKIAGIESNADTQKVAIQKAADDQLKANKNANDAEIADVKKQLADELAKAKAEKQSAIQDITNARDKAISDATDKLAAKLQSVQGDYDRWKASTINDFQGKLDKLTQQLNTDEADQARLKQAIDSAEEAISKIKDIDFTQYAHKDDLIEGYVELPVEGSERQQLHSHDGKALSFKKPLVNYDATLSKQGSAADAYAVGRRINDLDTGVTQLNQEIYNTFDTKGNAQDLKNEILANSSDITNLSGRIDANQSNITQAQKALDGKANSSDIISLSGLINANRLHITQLQQQCGSLQGTVNGKANSSDIISLSGLINANRSNISQAQKDITALQKAKPDLSGYETTTAAQTLSARITALENKKPIKADSQDDAVTKSKNSNDDYYW